MNELIFDLNKMLSQFGSFEGSLIDGKAVYPFMTIEEKIFGYLVTIDGVEFEVSNDFEVLTIALQYMRAKK